MGKKLFIGSLAWATDSSGLQAAFERFGEIEEATVISDRETGRSRGFGFVTFVDESSTQQAISEMNGSELDGRPIPWRRRRWRRTTRTLVSHSL